MRSSPSTRGARLRHAGWALAIVVAALGALALAARHRIVSDWTQVGRHTLANASIAALAAVAGPLEVSVYLPARHPGREAAQALVGRYQRFRPNLRLHFVPPAEVPELLRSQNLAEGDLVIAAGERREHLRQYTETAFTSALTRLARQDAQWLAFLTGHGERSPLRGANFDVSDFAAALAQRGLKAREINLAAQHAIPQNAAALVIASPQTDYLPGELALIEQYLAEGGALLWLREPPPAPALATLARALGVVAHAMTVVDPAAQAVGIDNPALVLVTRFGQHPALAQFSTTVVLPYATPLIVAPPAPWQHRVLFESAPGAWGETAPMSGEVAYTEGPDLKGPLPLAQALTRGTQRVVVVGDGDFLSNTYLGNGGNRALGTRLVEWLVRGDNLITIDHTPAADTQLSLARWQIGLLGGGFLLLLPGAFAGVGGWLWWRRRHA